MNMNKKKITRHKLFNTTTIIKNATWCHDFVDTMFVHTYLPKFHYEAFMEVKRSKNKREENLKESINKKRSQRHSKEI